MNLNEMFVCPSCGSHSINLADTSVLLSNVRSDILQCVDCGCMWRGYSMVTECRTEILQGASQPMETVVESDVTSEEVVVEE